LFIGAALVMWMESLPPEIPGYLVIFPSSMVMYAVARLRQSKRIAEHSAQGGQRASPLSAMAMGGSALAISFGLGHLGGAVLASGPHGRVMIHAQQFVFYDDGATEADAQRLGHALAKTPFGNEDKPFFSGTHPADVKVMHPKRGWVVAFVVVPGAWDQQPVRNGYQQLVERVHSALGDGPIEVQLCDDRWGARWRTTLP
jgi:hypothetical protein